MDKLELDARVSRLERRLGLLIVGSLIVPVALILILMVSDSHEDVATAATITAVPPPRPAPTPAPWVTPDSDPFMGSMGMMGGGAGSMAALFHELSTLTQLRDEGIVTAEEWQAKKARILENPLSPGDLRSDLQMVQQLSDTGAISEEDRVSLRTRLLGLDAPEALEMRSP